MENPFKLIENQLSNIHDLLIDLKYPEPQKQAPAEDKDELLTVAECAEFLSLSKATIYSKISRRELPYLKQGKRVYFLKDELLEFLKAGRQATKAEIEAEAGEYLANKKGGRNE